MRRGRPCAVCGDLMGARQKGDRHDRCLKAEAEERRKAGLETPEERHARKARRWAERQRKKVVDPKLVAARKARKAARRAERKRVEKLLDPNQVHTFRVMVRREEVGSTILTRDFEANTPKAAAQAAADALAEKAPGLWKRGVEVLFQVHLGEDLVMRGTFEPPPNVLAAWEAEKEKSPLILPPHLRDGSPKGLVVPSHVAAQVNEERRKAAAPKVNPGFLKAAGLERLDVDARRMAKDLLDGVKEERRPMVKLVKGGGRGTD